MNAKIQYFVLICVLSSVQGEDEIDNYQPSNYDISRNRQLGDRGSNYYPGYQPGVGYQPGAYPGQYPGQYPGHYENPGLAGPPGAHPGCPLCDSSVYSYCNHKQAHDSCCCGGGSYFSCRSVDCKFIYANSCKEYNLISRCCCVDLLKSAGQVPIVPVIAPVA